MFFVDVQGTLIEDYTKLPVRGAVEFIHHLNQNAIPYMVITNSTKNPSDKFLGYLHSIGLEIPSEKYLDPLMMLQRHIDKSQTIAAYGSQPFLEVLGAMGYVLDYDTPSVVLIAIKEDFHPDEYALIIEFLLSGAKLVGMHETSLYAKNHKRYPGVGAILKMLEFATSVPYTIVGKPSIAFFDEALKGLQKQSAHASYQDITIISDDLKGDIVGAQALGMKGILVLSGKIKSASEVAPFFTSMEHSCVMYADMHEVLENL
jgi:NagD protein